MQWQEDFWFVVITAIKLSHVLVACYRSRIFDPFPRANTLSRESFNQENIPRSALKMNEPKNNNNTLQSNEYT